MKRLKKLMVLVSSVAATMVLTGCDHIWREATEDVIPDRDNPTLNKENLYISNIDFSKIGEVQKDIPRPVVGSKLTYKENFDFNIADVHSTRFAYDLPAIGEQNILVIPVSFTDRLTNKNVKEKVRKDIERTFFGIPKNDESNIGWESLSSFYYKSSYGQLKLNGVVSEWYDSGMSTKEFANLSSSKSGYDPTWDMLSKAVEWYKNAYGTHATEFDKNSDGWIDGVWLVYGAENAENNNTYYKGTNNKKLYNKKEQDLYWAYTYYNYNEFDLGSRKNDPRPYHYCWASYDFMYEGFNTNKIPAYTSPNVKLDAHTYCHETGHLMGLPDYYVCEDKDGVKNYAPAGFVDMMDANVIDHNAYSKMQYGWITPYCPNKDLLKSGDSFEITIKPTVESGQCVILPTSKGWNKTAFDEYLLIEYYTPTGLNESDANSVYPNGVQGFKKPGIRLSHVDSRLVESKISFPSRESDKTPIGFTDKICSGGTLASLVYTDLAFSNTQGFSKYPNKLNREWQIIDAQNKINFDQDAKDRKKGYIANDNNLFHVGDSFRIGDYAKQFPRYISDRKCRMNNDKNMDYSFSVVSLGDEATLKITCNK